MRCWIKLYPKRLSLPAFSEKRSPANPTALGIKGVTTQRIVRKLYFSPVFVIEKMMSQITSINFCLFFLVTTFTSLSCDSGKPSGLKGQVQIDGSSTVFPITEAIAEEYREMEPTVRVTIGVSGTGGGFKKFLAKETDINDASRGIKEKEVRIAKENGIKYLELPVAYDGITVVINKANTWAQFITLAELKRIWEPGSQVKMWSDIRKEWPVKEIKLFGPGTDSGTFDYFTKAINGKDRASRTNYTMSEDDNVLVIGVSGNKYSLGYLGFAYYYENKTKLKMVAVGEDKKAVFPTIKTINNGSYKPLSRPVFIYVSRSAITRPEVKSFVKFYLDKAPRIVKEVGYIPLPDSGYTKAKSNLVQFIK